MMRTALADPITQSEGVTNDVMPNRIPDFAMPDPGVIGVEVAHLPYTACMSALSMDPTLQ